MKNLFSKATKVQAGNYGAREAAAKTLQPINHYVEVIDGAFDKNNDPISVHVYEVKNLTTGSYLKGKWENKKGKKMNLSPMAIESMYQISDVRSVRTNDRIRAVIMDSCLAKKSEVRKIVATYCYYLEHHVMVSEDIRFRILGNKFQDVENGIAGTVDGIELDSSRLLAYAQTAYLYGKKFTGCSFSPVHPFAISKRMEKNNEKALINRVGKDMAKDAKVQRKIVHSANKPADANGKEEAAVAVESKNA